MAHSPALVITMAKKLGIYLRYENIGCQVKLKSNEKVFYALLFYNIESVPELLGIYRNHKKNWNPLRDSWDNQIYP